MFRSEQARYKLSVHTAAEVAHLAESSVATFETLVIKLSELNELISDEDALTIALSLPKLKFPVIRIELSWIRQNSLLETLVEACKKCSAQIEFLMPSNAIHAISVESAMQCVKAIPDSNISLFTMGDDFLLTPPVVNALAEVLQSGNRHRRPFSLDVSWSSIGDEGVIAFAQALKSGHCPPYLDINIVGTEFGTQAIRALIEALKSGHCPSDLTLRFGSQTSTLFSFMEMEDVLALVEALCSQACPRHLTLVFSKGNFTVWDRVTHTETADISTECVRALAKAAVENLSLFIIGIDQRHVHLADRFPDHLAKEMQIISLCNRRNQLIKAHPILQFVYGNGDKSPFTLKDHCLFAVAKHADRSQLLSYNIPNELREELRELKGILSELERLVGKMTPIGMHPHALERHRDDSESMSFNM